MLTLQLVPQHESRVVVTQREGLRLRQSALQVDGDTLGQLAVIPGGRSVGGQNQCIGQIVADIEDLCAPIDDRGDQTDPIEKHAMGVLQILGQIPQSEWCRNSHRQ